MPQFCLRLQQRVTPRVHKNHVVTQPRQKLCHLLLAARPPAPPPSDNHQRTRRQDLAQRMFSIAAQAYLNSDFVAFNARFGDKRVLALFEELDRYARLIQRQTKRNDFRDDETHSSVKIIREGARGLQSFQRSFGRRVDDGDLQTRIQARPVEAVPSAFVPCEFGILDSHRSHEATLDP